MINEMSVFKAIPGFYKIIPLNVFRNTPGVVFDNVPTQALPRLDAIDRVIHESSAISPGPVGDVARPWYMHPYQDDNLVVLHGTRFVDIYIKKYGRIKSFEVTPKKRSLKTVRSFTKVRRCWSGLAVSFTGLGVRMRGLLL